MTNEKTEVTLEDVRNMSDEVFAGFFQRRAGPIYSLAYDTLGTRANVHKWMLEPHDTLGCVPMELILKSNVGLAKVKGALEKKAEMDKVQKGLGKH